MIAKVKVRLEELRAKLQGELGGANRALVVVKIAGVLAFLLGTNTARPRMGLVAWAIVGTIWVIGVVAVLHIAFFGRIVGRLVWTAMLVTAAFVGASFHVIFDLALNMFDLDKMLGNVGDANTVLPFYAPMLVAPATFCAIGLVAMNMPPFAKSVRAQVDVKGRLRHALGQATPIFVIALVLLLKRGEATNGFAVQHSLWSFALVLAGERAVQGARPARAEVTMTPAAKRPFKNVIVVMDESGRGASLDLNGEDGVETGLKGRPDAVSFGVMCSIANCSYESNVSFRFGVGREGYLEQLYANPSMWAYAKKAGYATYYLDAQRFEGRLQSGMDAKELELVDHHVQLGAAVLAEERDVKLAELVRKVLRDQAGAPTFMYVQKMGSHFPYEGKYPADQAVAKPTMERTYFGTEADPRPSQMKQASEDKAPDIRLRFKNSYDNSLRWNTKRFFEVVLDGLDLSDTLIVFMADHGQDLHQDGRAGFNTHCSTGSDAHPDEGRTFFVLLTHDQERLAAFRETAASHYDKTSQFSVFPSMLEWMGYPREEIAANPHFDPPLDAPPAPENRRFISKYFVRLGAKTIWSTCELPANAKVSSGPAPSPTAAASAAP